MPEEVAVWIETIPYLSNDLLRRAAQIALSALTHIIISRKLSDDSRALEAYDELRDALETAQAPTRH